MIELKDVSKVYGGHEVVPKLDLVDRTRTDDGLDRTERLRQIHAASA